MCDSDQLAHAQVASSAIGDLRSYIDGNAADFSGANALTGSHAIATDWPVSLGCWFKIASVPVSQSSLMALADTSVTTRWMGLRVASSTGRALAMNLGGGTVRFATSDTDVCDNAVHFAVAVFHAADLRRIYVDDEAVVGNAFSEPFPTGQNAVTIGAMQTTVIEDPIDATIDNAFVYLSALTSDQRLWMYNSGAGRSYSQLLTSGDANNPGKPAAYWSLKEAAGSNRLDWSGNKYTLGEAGTGTVTQVAGLI